MNIFDTSTTNICIVKDDLPHHVFCFFAVAYIVIYALLFIVLQTHNKMVKRYEKWSKTV